MENLGIDGKLLMAQIVNFLLFFILIKKFVLKPFNAFLAQEKKQDKEKEDALEKIKKTEEQMAEQDKKLKEKAKKEIGVLFEQAKKDARDLRADLLKQAELDAQEVRNRTKKLMGEEREALYKDVREKIADLSMHLVTEGLKDSLDAETKKKVTARILKNLTSGNVTFN